MLAPCACASNNERGLLPWLPQGGGVASAQISPRLPIAALIELLSEPYLHQPTPVSHVKKTRAPYSVRDIYQVPDPALLLVHPCHTVTMSHAHFITQSCVFVPSSSQQFHPWSISIIHSLSSILWSLCAFGRLCWVWFEPALEVDVANRDTR